MKSFTSLKSAALLAVLSSAAAASSASAMPVDGGAAARTAAGNTAPLQRVVDGHRVYPGSDSAAAQKNRDERNAPNRFCEKQQQYCE